MSTPRPKRWLHTCALCSGWAPLDHRVCFDSELSVERAAAFRHAIVVGNLQAQAGRRAPRKMAR